MNLSLYRRCVVAICVLSLLSGCTAARRMGLARTETTSGSNAAAATIAASGVGMVESTATEVQPDQRPGTSAQLVSFQEDGSLELLPPDDELVPDAPKRPDAMDDDTAGIEEVDLNESDPDDVDQDNSDMGSNEDSDEESARSSTQSRLLDIMRPTTGDNPLPLEEVIGSVQSFFPMLRVAVLERDRTAGDQLAAWGEFDTKLKGFTENQPFGYYENYQQSFGAIQPLYQGGEVYGGYRLGRGSFEPWYQERQTNDGGEFKVGTVLPLLRNREIDKRRADLWRATYDRQLAEPFIRNEVIQTIREASVTYWMWVAAGQQYQIGQAALDLAERRNEQIETRVTEGDLDPPSLKDNLRAIADRKAKLVDRERKLIQTGVKLSLFLRGVDANPVLPDTDRLPAFPDVEEYDTNQMNVDIAAAVTQRPELVELDTLVRRTQVDLAEACNDTLPTLDATANMSQDVGRRTSSSGDKSPMEVEMGLLFEMPVQRRKGFGKARSARAKLQQLAVKRQFTVEKITTEVQAAVAALDAAYERVQEITESVELTEELARIERIKFEEGQSDLFTVFLREQQAIEAADNLVIARLEYYVALADFAAALAYDYPVLFDPTFVPGAENIDPVEAAEFIFNEN